MMNFYGGAIGPIGGMTGQTETMGMPISGYRAAMAGRMFGAID